MIIHRDVRRWDQPFLAASILHFHPPSPIVLVNNLHGLASRDTQLVRRRRDEIERDLCWMSFAIFVRRRPECRCCRSFRLISVSLGYN